MKTIILTGANGFIGRHTISHLLDKNYEIHAISRGVSCINQDNLTWHQCDLLNASEQEELFNKIKPSYLLHFAWYTAHKNFWTSDENLKWVQASLNILKNFSLNGGQRAVLAGTCAEYDWNCGYLSDTKTPLKPSTLYGMCKNSLQEIASEFFKQKKISYAWGRIFSPYGPFENPSRMIPRTIISLLLKQPINCISGNKIRDFIYVDDISSAFVSLLDSDIQGSINMASGMLMSNESVIYKIANKLKGRDLINFETIENLDNDPYFLLADTTRLNKDVNWKPKYTLDDGLDKTIRWWDDRIKRGLKYQI